MQNLILVGYGNLAHSIVQGFLTNQVFQHFHLFVFGRDYEKSLAFASRYDHIQAIASLEEHLMCDSILVLCIKPVGIQSFRINQPFFLLYSVLAGVKINGLKSSFPRAQNITRAMPNIGASIQKSSTSLFSQGSQEAKSLSLKLTQSFGEAILLESEDLIDSSIATNGSSPAFLSLVAEALIESGVREGIPYSQSKELVYATFRGFSELLDSYSPQEIKTLVTSPAGTTAEGLAYLENKGLKGILQEAGHRSVLKAKGKL